MLHSHAAGSKAAWLPISRNSSWMRISWAFCTGLAKGVTRWTMNAQAMDAIREVGPGGHYLGCAHTQSEFQICLLEVRLAGLQTVRDVGGRWRERDTQTLAGNLRRVEKLLADYQKPAMDPAVAEALSDYVARKREPGCPMQFTCEHIFAANAPLLMCAARKTRASPTIAIKTDRRVSPD